MQVETRDLGLGIRAAVESVIPIPNPQSPIPNPHYYSVFVTVHELPAEHPAFLAQCRLSLRERRLLQPVNGYVFFKQNVPARLQFEQR